MRPDRPVPLKTSSLVNVEPALSREGKDVVFVARESGAWELQLINLANGALTHCPSGFRIFMSRFSMLRATESIIRGNCQALEKNRITSCGSEALFRR